MRSQPKRKSQNQNSKISTCTNPLLWLTSWKTPFRKWSKTKLYDQITKFQGKTIFSGKCTNLRGHQNLDTFQKCREIYGNLKSKHPKSCSLSLFQKFSFLFFLFLSSGIRVLKDKNPPYTKTTQQCLNPFYIFDIYSFDHTTGSAGKMH